MHMSLYSPTHVLGGVGARDIHRIIGYIIPVDNLYSSMGFGCIGMESWWPLLSCPFHLSYWDCKMCLCDPLVPSTAQVGLVVTPIPIPHVR